MSTFYSYVKRKLEQRANDNKKKLHERYAQKIWDDNFSKNDINRSSQTYNTFMEAMNQFNWKYDSSISQYLNRYGIRTKPLIGDQDWGRYDFYKYEGKTYLDIRYQGDKEAKKLF